MEIVIFAGEMQLLVPAAARAGSDIYIACLFNFEICSEKTDKKHNKTSVFADYIIIRRKYLVKKKTGRQAVKVIPKSTFISRGKRQAVPVWERGGENS